MPLSYAQELQKKKEEEERQKAEQKVVGQQQKTQPEASKPTGSTSIPTREANKETARTDNGSSRSTSRVGDTEAKRQARTDREKGVVDRDVTNRRQETDTHTRRTEFRDTKQINEDKRKEKRLNLPGYSNSQYAKNSNYSRIEPRREANNNNNSNSNSNNQGANRPDISNNKTWNDLVPQPERQQLRTWNDIAPNNNQGLQSFNELVQQGQMPYPQMSNEIVPGSQYYGGNGQTIGGGTLQRLPSPEDFPDAMGSSVQQVNNLQQYINSTPSDFSGDTIGSAQTAKEELEKLLYGDRQALTENAVNDSNPFTSFFAGAGNGVLSTLGDISAVTNNALEKLAPSTEGMTPDEIYNSAMENLDKGWLRNPTKDQRLYSEYKNYIQQRMASGDVTPQEIQNMQNLEAAYSKIGSHYLEELGKDAEAINAGYQQENPIANAAGQMVPMILGNVALSGLGVGSGAAAAAEKISNPMLRFAAKQGANLIPDLIVDTAPEVLSDIADNKSKEEIAKDALMNIGLNAGANVAFDYAPQAIKAIADQFNGSNTAKQTVNNVIPEVAEQATKNVVPDVGVQTAKEETREKLEQRFKDNIKRGTERLDRINMVQDAANSGQYRRFGNLQEVNIGEFINGDGRLSEKLLNHPEINTISEAVHKSTEQLDYEASNIMEQIYRYRNGRMSRKEVLQLGDAPEILKEYGLGDKPLYMKQDDIRKVLAMPGDKVKHPHFVGTGAFEAIPEKLDNPVAIIRNKSKDKVDNLIVLTDLANQEGDPALMALKVYKDGSVVVENRMASMYGKSNINDYLSREIGNGDVLYIDKTKSAYDKAHGGLQSATGTSNALNVGAVDQAAPSINNVAEGITDVNARDIVENAGKTAQNTVPGAENLTDATEPENFLDEWARTHPEDVAEDTAKAANNATTNDTAISQARTNVFERSGIDAEESKNIYRAEDYSYVKDSNPAQMERAAENLNRLGDDAVKHYTSNDFDPKKASVEDVDSMMMLTERLRNEARATSDVVEKSKLYAQSRDLSIKSVQAASEFGRDLQSWSKWADTPERVVDKGYGVLLNKTDDFLKSNPRVKWGIEDISDGIEKLFKEKDVAKVMESGDAEAIAKLKREISNGIDDLIKNADKGTQKALKGLSEKEIDQLMYENSTKSISQALEMFAGTGSMGLKDSTVDEIFDLMAKNESLNPNSKAFVQNEKKIYSMIANDLTKGGTFGQKVDTWRYLSMLTNPSTHLRNLTGNITMQGVAGVKNDLAAIIESAADRVSKSGIDRTKGIVNPFTDSDLLAATKKDAIDNAYRQLSGNRYTGISQGIESEVKAFKDKGVGKAINKISDVNSGALSAEDEFFKVNEYSTALAGYLKGNGFDASILGEELSEENAKQLKKIFGKGQRARAGIDSLEGMKDQFLQDARAYAVNQANVQTFNNTNANASKFSKYTKGLRESDDMGAKALGYALDITIPFKNVPANVLRTALAYSPAEIIKLVPDAVALKKGTMTAADFIDDVSKFATGTAGMTLGALLAHEGIVRMGSEKGTREKNFDKATDKLNGAIDINGKSVDVTQLMPSAAPLIYGAMVYDVMANKDNGLTALDTFTKGISALADGVTDMTMLSGLSDILEAGKYADDKNSIWGTIGAKVASNALSQMVPTVGGKIEKIFDDTQRNSWYSDKAGLAKDAETAAKYNSTKIIGAQALGENLKDSDNKVLSTIGDLTGLEPRINSKGEEMKNKGGNALGRAVNAVLPLELGSDNSTETDNKLRELAYKFPAGDERDAIFPYAKQSEAKFNNADGEQVQLTPEQWTEYQKSKGQMTNEMIDKFLNSDSYEQMEDVDRAETLKKMYDFATKYNQHVIGDGKLSKDMQELADIYESDGVDGVLSQMMGKAIAESAGVRGNSNAAKAIQEDIANGNMDAANEKAEAYGSLSDYGLTNKSAINVYNYAAENNSDVNIEEFAETYKKLDSNENGSITQKELLEYANSGDHTQEEIDQLWDTYLAGSYTKVPVLEDGEWKSKKPSSETTNTPKTETTTKPTNTTQTQKGNATAKPKSGLSKRQQVAQQHSWTNNQSAKTENSIPDATDLPDASTDIAPKSTVRSYVDQNGNTQTYDMATTKWYQNGISAGYSSDDVIRMHDEANYDGQGKVTKDEAKQYINSNYANASAEEKRRLFSFICTSKAKNPY